MNGEIGVESEPGAGSCFWVRLPLAIAATQAPAPKSAAMTAAAEALDVLVVEDNATNRIVLQEMLHQLGHRVTLAEDGGQGLEAARAHRFDVILMDISMPLMDGLTATALIRMEGCSARSRILAVTAHSLPADLERFRQAGMDGCLTKPISLRDLAQTLAGGSALNAAFPPQEGHMISLDRLKDLRDGLGTAGLARMLARFRVDFGSLQARLETACDAAGFAELLPLCHEGAGLCAMVGASALHQHFVAAEDLCRSGTPAQAAALLQSQTGPLWQKTQTQLQTLGLPG
jgi:CheY-like chemotaxis protein